MLYQPAETSQESFTNEPSPDISEPISAIAAVYTFLYNYDKKIFDPKKFNEKICLVPMGKAEVTYMYEGKQERTVLITSTEGKSLIEAMRDSGLKADTDQHDLVCAYTPTTSSHAACFSVSPDGAVYHFGEDSRKCFDDLAQFLAVQDIPTMS